MKFNFKNRVLSIPLFVSALIAPVSVYADVTIDEAHFPDEAFRKYLMSTTYGKDGVFTNAELSKFIEMTIGLSYSTTISDLTGIEYFASLQKLNVQRASNLTSVDLSSNKQLTTLYLSRCNISPMLDLTANTKLDVLDLENNTNLTELKLGGTAFTDIRVDNCPVSELNVRDFGDLKKLSCKNCGLTSLDISANKNLTWVECSFNSIAELDIKNNTNLEYFACGNNKTLKTLDVSANKLLKHLSFSTTGVTSIDLSNNTELELLQTTSSKIGTLDLTNLTKLKTLYCSASGLKELDLSNQAQLTFLDCSLNYSLRNLNLENQTELAILRCNNCDLYDLDLSNNTKLTELDCRINKLTSLDLTKHPNLAKLTATGNTRTVNVNYMYKKDGTTYYYLDMDYDERGLQGDEFHNKVGQEFKVDNVTQWNTSEVGLTPGEGKALIFDGKPTSITYDYNTEPSSTSVNGVVTFTLKLTYNNVTTGIETVGADSSVKVYATQGAIKVEGNDGVACVYTLSGQNVYTGNDSVIPVHAGIYLVKVGNKAYKIAVR